MTNIEKLNTIGILGDVRQRLGANDENDESKDKRINNMNNHQLIKEYAGWNLGDDGWWVVLKSHFDALERLK